MLKTLFLLTGLALVQARSGGNAVYNVITDECETLANGCPADFTIQRLIPHEKYCHLFYYCEKGELVLRSCPEPLYFHPLLQICVWSSQTDCVNDGPYTYPPTLGPEVTTPQDIGDVLDNGCPANFAIQHLLPHAECEKYYQCYNGQKLVQDCQPGTVFNFPAQNCDWPYNVPQCAGSPGATAPPTADPDSNEELPLPNDPDDWEALPNGCPANFEIVHLLPHESECGKFYACDNGGLVELLCPPGLHFSPTLQTCTWPREAGCEHWTDPCGPGGGGDCGSTNAPTTAPTTTAAPTAAPTTTAAPTAAPTTTAAPTAAPTTTAAPTAAPTTTAAPTAAPTTTAAPTAAPTTTAAPTAAPTTTAAPTAAPTTTAAPTNAPTTAPPDSSEEIPIPSDPESTVPPSTTTTGTPGCPECPPGPVNPADKCKNDCNVVPWPHPECDKYYYCIGDQFRLGICSEGLHFNPSTFTCDFICNAGCARIIPQITRHADGLLTFVPNAWGNTAKVMDMIERELNAEL